MTCIDVSLGNGIRCRSRHRLTRKQLARSARPNVAQGRQPSQRVSDGNVLQRDVARVLGRERVGDDVTHNRRILDRRGVSRLGELHRRSRGQRGVRRSRRRRDRRTGRRSTSGGGAVGDMAGVDIRLRDGVRCRSRDGLAREQLAGSSRPGVSQSRQTSQRVSDGNVAQLHVAGVLRREGVDDAVTYYGRVLDTGGVRRLGELHCRSRGQRGVRRSRRRRDRRTGRRSTRRRGAVGDMTGVDISLGDCIRCRSRDGLARKQLTGSTRPGVSQS
ncbi:hypothetical protein PJL18_02477 [Paenarthrobacter nicotinovorans]|nr:hypothetical protein [Paenarthrobacter nicotinovorans]